MNRTKKLKLEQKIISMLQRQPKTASELYSSLGIGSVTLSGVLRSLAKIGVIEKKQNRYEVIQ